MSLQVQIEHEILDAMFRSKYSLRVLHWIWLVISPDVCCMLSCAQTPEVKHAMSCSEQGCKICIACMKGCIRRAACPIVCACGMVAASYSFSAGFSQLNSNAARDTPVQGRMGQIHLW